MSENSLIEKLKESIIEYDEDKAIKVAEEIVKANIDILNVIEKGISSGAQMVSEKFELKSIIYLNYF